MTIPYKEMQELTGTACIITGDLLETVHAKTAHGLIRDSSRFKIVGVIDKKSAGKDAGEVLYGIKKDIPVFSSFSELLKISGTPDYAIIGMATKGGLLPESLYPIIEEVLNAGISLINGLHQPLSEIPVFKEIAERTGVHIYDIRKSKPFRELHFWKGKIDEVDSLKIGVLGTDCGLGKRTTAKLLMDALNKSGVKAAMIYTGQTGWLQGLKHGFIFDATPNDFIPGELEHAIYTCWEELKPDVILIEGQASLRNPGGPCGTELIISGKLDGVILQHHPLRTKFLHLEYYPANIPDPADEINLIKMFGAPTWAVTLNTSGVDRDLLPVIRKSLQASTGLPVIYPIEDGTDELVQIVKEKLIPSTHEN